MLKWLWLSAAVIALDQLSKYMATASLDPYQPVGVLPFFNLTLMFNTGAAFSFLSTAAGWQRWFFTLVALAVCVVLVVWLKRLRPGETWVAVALSLILGGALGNVWDRLWLGHVVDFLDFYVGSWHWPAFNVADSAITVGAIMLIIDAIRGATAADPATDRSNSPRGGR